MFNFFKPHMIKTNGRCQIEIHDELESVYRKCIASIDRSAVQSAFVFGLLDVVMVRVHTIICVSHKRTAWNLSYTTSNENRRFTIPFKIRRLSCWERFAFFFFFYFKLNENVSSQLNMTTRVIQNVDVTNINAWRGGGEQRSKCLPCAIIFFSFCFIANRNV